MKVEIPSPAKINPELRVLRRLPNGMHEVETTLLALDFGDRVEVERIDGGGTSSVRIRLTGEALSDDVPRNADNLACRAAALVLELFRARGGSAAVGLLLRIDKRIPSRAGLGGGSSNAAAALFGAAGLLSIAVDDPGLVRGLAELGADTAFFVHARTTGFALCRGVGERVTPLEPASTERAFVVLTPRVTCSTADVYAALEPSELGVASEARGARDAVPCARRWLDASLEDARAALVNQLEPAALRSHPELARFRNRLDRAGASHFRLAGSGSSFFGLFADTAAAEEFLDGEAVASIARHHGLRAKFVARPFA